MKNKFKILILLVIGTFAVSCSDDDNATADPEPVAVYPKKIVIDIVDNSYDLNFDFVYDAQKRISKIVSTGHINSIYSLSYNAKNQVSGVVVTGDNPKTVVAAYDADGNLKSYAANGGVPVTITYNATTQMFEGAQYPYSLTQEGNINILGPSFLGYDNTKKGAFISTGINYMALTFIAETNFIYVVPTKPINSVSSGSSAYTVANSYAENGQIKLFDITDNINPLKSFTIAYEYTTL